MTNKFKIVSAGLATGSSINTLIVPRTANIVKALIYKENKNGCSLFSDTGYASRTDKSAGN